MEKVHARARTNSFVPRSLRRGEREWVEWVVGGERVCRAEDGSSSWEKDVLDGTSGCSSTPSSSSLVDIAWTVVAAVPWLGTERDDGDRRRSVACSFSVQHRMRHQHPSPG